MVSLLCKCEAPHINLESRYAVNHAVCVHSSVFVRTFVIAWKTSLSQHINILVNTN